jgi:23S rRNA (guanosine2251-2'-O)-methyltransferase
MKEATGAGRHHPYCNPEHYNTKIMAHSTYYMYGWHACLAALENPARQVKRVMASEQTAKALPQIAGRPKTERTHGRDLDTLLGKQAVHQGIALEVMPLNPVALHTITSGEAGTTLLLLDQVTDPHNLGAILRSAAAFGVDGVITTKDRGAGESAVMAKAACGALEMVPLIPIINLAQTIGELQKEGYWVMGLDGEASGALHQSRPTEKTALVLGAEGPGLRRLTKERCDELIKLPIHPQMESLNVSNAAAIALYQLYLNGLSA